MQFAGKQGFTERLRPTIAQAVGLMACVAMLMGGSAAAVDYTYNIPSSSITCLTGTTISASGVVSCAPAGTLTSSPPFVFSNGTRCSAGIVLKLPGTYGSSVVECATTLPDKCTLTPSLPKIAPGDSVMLTVNNCSPAATQYDWSGTGLTNQTTFDYANTNTAKLTAEGYYTYSVLTRNEKGAGSTATAVVKVAVAGQMGPYAYVPSQVDAPPKAGILKVIDTATNTVITSVTVGVYPTGVAANPAGTRVYVTNSGSNTVSVIDTATNQVISGIIDPKTNSAHDYIPVGVNPIGVAVAPDGKKAYVANSASGTVSVIDTETNKVDTVNVGGQPQGVAVAATPLGVRVYVANMDSGSKKGVVVIDATSNSIIGTVPTDNGPYGVAVKPDGSKAYVTNSGSKTVSVIDTASNTAMSIGVGSNPRGIAINPAGTLAYVVNNGDRTISLIDIVAGNTTYNTVIATLNNVGPEPFNVAFHPAGYAAYVANAGDGTVTTIDTASRAAIGSALSVGGHPYALGQFTGPVAKEKVYQDLWWNPNESGWGMTVTQHGKRVWSTIYTYDSSGKPIWYAMDQCTEIPNSTDSTYSCDGPVWQFIGGHPPNQPWNTAKPVPSQVGTGMLKFKDGQNMSFSYTPNGGQTWVKNLTRQPIATGANSPLADFTDLWWNPSEPGWGVGLIQQFGIVFATWYAYDDNGNPVWYVADKCPLTSSSPGYNCKSDLYATKGTSLIAAWDAANTAVSKVGTVTFTFSDSKNGQMNYSINNVSGTRSIMRQEF